MFNFRSVIRVAVLLLVVIILMAGSAMSFDGKRKGFIIGGGVGPGITIANMEYEPHLLSTSFKIGLGTSEQFQLYWMSKVSWYSVDYYHYFDEDHSVTEAFGVAGAGMSYYFFPASPSGYVTAGLGYSGVNYPAEHGLIDSRWGFGLNLGLGWEFTRHVSLESNLICGAIHYSDLDYPMWSFTVTLNALAY